MPDAAWKAWERRVARSFGGERRGPLTRGADGGKTDVVVEGYAIECKLLSRPSFQQMLEAALQAEHNGEPGDIPLAVIKRKRDQDAHALVVMRLPEFMAWFGGGECSSG